MKDAEFKKVMKEYEELLEITVNSVPVSERPSAVLQATLISSVLLLAQIIQEYPISTQ